MVWRLATKEVHTDRHQSSIAMSRRGCQHIDERHAAPMLGEIDTRPLSFSTPKLDVHLLDVMTRKLFIYVQIQADQTKHHADRAAVAVRGLYGECVRDVLQDKSGAAHHVDVKLVVCGTDGIHLENSVTRELSTCDRGPAS